MNQTTYWTLNLKVARLDFKLSKWNFLLKELLRFDTSTGSAYDHRRDEVVMKWAGKKSDWIIQEMWTCFRSLRRRRTFAP